MRGTSVPIGVSKSSDPRPPAELIDIGGQHLHVYGMGKGTPTVILESGTGDVSAIWALVQPESRM